MISNNSIVITMVVVMYRSIALMALLAVLTGIPALAFDNIPGDLNGDRVVSDDELKIAEESYAKGEISSDSLSEIRHIHEMLCWITI